MRLVVVGPPGAGKTTIARAFGAALPALQLVHVDASRQQLYRPFGYMEARADKVFDQLGTSALHGYESQFEVRALHRILAIREHCIVDASGGVLLQQLPSNQLRLQSALKLADCMILVTPHVQSHSRSVDELRRRVMLRNADKPDPDAVEWLRRGGDELLAGLSRAACDVRESATVVVDTAIGSVRARCATSAPVDVLTVLRQIVPQ